MTNDPRSSDFSYKKYSLEQLDNWVNDALNCEDLTPQDIYDTVVKCVDESVEYHKKYLTKSIELLSLLKGQGTVDLGLDTFNYEPYEGWDCGNITLNQLESLAKTKTVSEASKSDWVDFWEENYYPQEYEKTQYTETELDAMCEAASQQEERDKCREYNLREAEYYNQRALIDAKYNKMKEEVSRNDLSRLKYENGWIYESPDGGKTVTKRKPGTLEKFEVKADGYSVSKTWTLPVQQGSIDGVDDYYIEFPDDLMKAADLKEGDSVEWIEREDGSYQLRKITKPLGMEDC